MGSTEGNGHHSSAVAWVGENWGDGLMNGHFRLGTLLGVADAAASFLTNSNSHLFFGKSAPEDFDDLSIVAPPVPNTDCNGNGNEDSVDIEGGPSVDRNANGIPELGRRSGTSSWIPTAQSGAPRRRNAWASRRSFEGMPERSGRR
jgi:hypothetical protein